jgi:hypothetical protein
LIVFEKKPDSSSQDIAENSYRQLFYLPMPPNRYI